MSHLITLMYHSIYSNDDEWNQIKPEDQPYALHIDTFNLHMDYLKSNAFNIVDPNACHSLQNLPEDLPGKSVLITFDDGHIGFYKYAFPSLIQRHLSAIFFITSDLINQPKPTEYCSWSQLKEMADAGMSIQSHGKSHDFFADMNHQTSTLEFKTSLKEIEEKTGCKVSAISFPGGRYSQKNIQCGQLIGYSYFFTSDFGFNKTSDLINGGVFFRHAIRVNTDLPRFINLLNINGTEYYKSKTIFLVKKMLKLVIGNKNYHRLYKFIS